MGKYTTILCKKENFLLNADLCKINQAVPNYTFIFSPAIKKELDRDRPFNGMFIGYPSTIKDLIKTISLGNPRFQAIIIKINIPDKPMNWNNMIFNTYFNTV